MSQTDLAVLICMVFTVHSENDMKYARTLCGQISEFFGNKAGGRERVHNAESHQSQSTFLTNVTSLVHTLSLRYGCTYDPEYSDSTVTGYFVNVRVESFAEISCLRNVCSNYSGIHPSSYPMASDVTQEVISARMLNSPAILISYQGPEYPNNTYGPNPLSLFRR